tara:strand:+ start:5345 stop:5611 length:267 start_codon:yes stop_codon:yes gene_type:complete
MFVLVDKNSGGVYAVRDDGLKERVVQIFSESDDAERYYGHLIANDYKRQLKVMEIEEGDVKRNCNQFGYHYSIIQPDDIVFPPIHDNL